MLGAVAVLALIAGLLAIISMIPQAQSYPLLSVSALLLAVALFLVGAR